MNKMDDERASRRILAVTEEELSRIVLDIHDGPVQYLFAALSLITRLQLEARAADCRTMIPTLDRIAELTESALHEIKSFLGTFRPPEFHRRSLESIVKGLIIQHEERTGHTVHLLTDSLPDGVALPVKIAIYRILQEALSNAYRHAGVKEQWVRLIGRGDAIIMEIEDRGRGFQPPPLDGRFATEREEHIGLRGMRDRVTLLGGAFRLFSQPGRGTRITVKLPAFELPEADLCLSQFE